MSSDAALLAEIAALDKAIAQARRPPPPSARAPYKPHAHPYHHPRPPPTAAGSRNKKLVLNSAGAPRPAPAEARQSAAGPSRTSKPTHPPAVTFPVPVPASAAAGPSTQWVQKTGRNMSLMSAETYEKAEKARLARPPPPIRKPAPSTPSGAPRQVVIDGTVFEFDASGTKLNKVEGQSDSPNPARWRHSLFGQDYVRTKSGNLLSAAVVRSRKGRAGPSAEEMAGKRERLGNMTLVLNGVQKARNDQAGKSSSSSAAAALKKSKKAQTLCQFYTKTGRCNNAFSCPYLHDPSKLSICPKYLRSTCPHTASSCPLSHTSSTHNAPSCVHFQTTGSCRAGEECRYAHVRVGEGALVCGDFARYGWCERGQEVCGERHVWECKEWGEKGTCRRKGKCGLRHVLKAEVGRVVPTTEEEDDGGRREEEEVGGFVVDTVGTGVRESRKSGGGGGSGMESLVQQDDFIQFSTFGGSSDEEGGDASSDEEDASDDDGSSVDSDGGEEDEVEDRIGDLVDALMSEPDRSGSREEEEEGDGRRGDEDEE